MKVFVDCRYFSIAFTASAGCLCLSHEGQSKRGDSECHLERCQVLETVQATFNWLIFDREKRSRA
jgi:hypothetical protein